jgi:hypothetical protein
MCCLLFAVALVLLRMFCVVEYIVEYVVESVEESVVESVVEFVVCSLLWILYSYECYLL